MVGVIYYIYGLFLFHLWCDRLLHFWSSIIKFMVRITFTVGITFMVAITLMGDKDATGATFIRHSSA